MWDEDGKLRSAMGAYLVLFELYRSKNWQESNRRGPWCANTDHMERGNGLSRKLLPYHTHPGRPGWCDGDRKAQLSCSTLCCD